jgi:hypothetical protein
LRIPKIENAGLAFSAVGIIVLAVALFLPPVHQVLSYHDFADQRPLWGIPHFLNVASNLPFLAVGLLGIWFMGLQTRNSQIFLDSVERWPYLILFVGVSLTALGSGYYHLAPKNDRLVWDRLPMAVSFMAFFAANWSERIKVDIGTWLLGPLVLLGAASVVNWQRTDDLRFYAVVQYYPLIIIPVMLCVCPPRYTGTGYIWGALGWYTLAKILELHAVDHGIFSLGGVVSGHTLKHLAAASGAFWIYLFLKNRRYCGQWTVLPRPG